MRSEGLGAPRERTEVLRIGDAVEDDEERLGRASREQIGEFGVAEFGDLGADPLMSAARRTPLELPARRVLDTNAGFVRGQDHALGPV